jgi:hypothetical protein
MTTLETLLTYSQHKHNLRTNQRTNEPTLLFYLYPTFSSTALIREFRLKLLSVIQGPVERILLKIYFGDFPHDAVHTLCHTTYSMYIYKNVNGYKLD